MVGKEKVEQGRGERWREREEREGERGKRGREKGEKKERETREKGGHRLEASENDFIVIEYIQT